MRPATTGELAEILGADSRPFELVGAGSKRAIGRPVEAEPLELSALAGVIDYHPAELVLTARAGTLLGDLEALLGGHNQRLAFEPPSLAKLLHTRKATDTVSEADFAASEQTIGGVLAANLSGSRRIAAGAARDHLLGVTAVNGQGQVFRAGGKVVKNVTGYDLPKLLAGSWGTLAVMSEVTLKVMPKAEDETTLILPDRETGDAVRHMSVALGSAHEVSSAAYDPWRGTALRLEGQPASIAAREAALLAEFGNPEVDRLERDSSRSFWRALAGAEALADWRVVWRISVPPAAAPRVVETIRPERWFADWGGGLIWAGFDNVDAALVRGALDEGHATLIKAPADTRPCRIHPPTAVVAQLLERVRDAFDPDRRLNPGRMD